MKHFIWYINVILILVQTSCSVFTKTKNETLMFSMETTPCYGTCPVYKLEVYSSGKAILNGKENIDYIGEHSVHIKSETLNKIIKNFDDISFFELENSYRSLFKDLPTKYITYYKNGGSKTVMAYDNIPKELSGLIDEIESLVKELKWKQN